MLYLNGFRFPNYDTEYSFRLRLKATCYNTMYPFFVLSKHGLSELDFEPITILYGGNGCGKTTALNVIAEKLKLLRDSPFNRSDFFENYCDLCRFSTENIIPQESRIITSDDVFEYMLNIRRINEGIDTKRQELFSEYAESKYANFRVQSLDDYEKLKNICDSRRMTTSKYVKNRLTANVKEQSNGESAFMYFTQKIKNDALFLLDEPENSLSPERQIELAKFLEDSARFYGCQIIMATHSPFLLALKGAKIYDLDEELADVKKWTDLKNVQTFYKFFKDRENEFKK